MSRIEHMHSSLREVARDERPGPRFHEIDIDPAWLDFGPDDGPDDPLEADTWINPCAGCGATPELRFVGTAHAVQCGCGASGNPGKIPAIAAVNWNKSPASLHPSYRDLPFFQLADLEPPQARAKLILIREYLVEQKRRCEWRIKTRQGVGHRYFQRIKAYLAWSIYALGLVREQETLADPAATPRAALTT